MSGQLEFGEEDRAATLARAWELALHLLASKVSTVAFATYIQPVQPLSYVGNVVTMGVANAFFRERLEKNHVNAIRSALEFHLDTTGLQIEFVALSRDQQRTAETKKADTGRSKSRPEQPALPLDDMLDDTDESAYEATQAGHDVPSHFPAPKPLPPSEAVRPIPQQPVPTLQPPTYSVARPPGSGRAGGRKAESKPAEPELPIPGLPLNDRYRFATFLVGQSNRLAHAGANSVAERPGEVYNPLFLYGGPGLGKTHLLHGIAHRMRSSNPNLRLAYVSGEYFTQHYVTALREHTSEDFRRQYRAIDVWLVDDIQFIAGKEKTNEEFFHTFNMLYQNGRQIVIASDRSPRELNTMDERLRSRFQSGLIADISAPDYETRLAILQQCCQREGFVVEDSILEYIASAIQSNIRALEGALTKLIAYSSIHNTRASAELAQSVLSEYFIEKPIRYRKISIDDVVDAVAAYFGTTSLAIKGPNRNKDVSLARQVAMYLCRELMPELNTTMAGTAFGDRDHATIVYACQRVRGLMEMDAELKSLVVQLQKQLNR